MRPGFIPSAEAPITTALFGHQEPPELRHRARRQERARDGAGARARRRPPAVRPRRRRGGSPPARSARARPAGRSRPSARRGGPGRGPPRRAAPRGSRRPGCSGDGRVSASWASVPRNAVGRALRGQPRGRDHRAGPVGSQRAQEGLGVEPTHPQDHHRSEGRVVPQRRQELAAEPRLEPHPLDDQRSRDPGRGRRRPRRRQHPPDRGPAPRRPRSGRPRPRRRRSCGAGPARRPSPRPRRRRARSPDGRRPPRAPSPGDDAEWRRPRRRGARRPRARGEPTGRRSRPKRGCAEATPPPSVEAEVMHGEASTAPRALPSTPVILRAPPRRMARRISPPSRSPGSRPCILG